MRLVRLRRRWLASALTALLGLAAACKEGEPLLVEGLEFRGVEHVNEASLRAVLATQAGSWIPFSRKPPFDREEFASDLKRVRAFYADRGFPDARVTHVDVDLDSSKKKVRIRVVVSEGDPVRLGAVRLTGVEGVPERRRRALNRLIGLQPGDLRDRERIASARDVIANELKEHGYPYVRVDSSEEPGERPREVVLTLAADAGPLATFGPIEVSGNQSVSNDVILRQLTFDRGERYRQSRVQESQRRFSSLELFDFAYVEPRGRETRPPEVPIRVTVTEGKHRRFTAAAGYGTEEKGRVRGTWDHVNFFGGARSAGVEAKYSWLDRGARVYFTEPYFFTRHLAFSLRGHAWNEHEPVFQLTSYGGRATVTWRRDQRDLPRARGASTTVSLSVIDELTDYAITEEGLADEGIRNNLIALGLDPETGAARGTVVALRLEAERSTVANRLDARRGYIVSAALERAGGFLPGTFTYTEVSGELRHYLSLGRRRVLAQRARVASIDAPAPTDASVPFYKRYFLGGASSIRGWGRYEVAPLTETGFPVGGLTLVELSSELRVPVTRKLGVVAFVDAGNVSPEPWRVSGLRVAVGPGIRYDTPIGPARFDVGFQLNPIDGLMVNGEPQSRAWRAHISIGQAF
jgi:outer membrane protein insertion porin family/translocation and assembly module TamA